MSLENVGEIKRKGDGCEIQFMITIPSAGFIATAVIFFIMCGCELVNTPPKDCLPLALIFLVSFGFLSLMLSFTVLYTGSEYRNLIGRVIDPCQNFDASEFIEEKKADQWKFLITVIIVLAAFFLLGWFILQLADGRRVVRILGVDMPVTRIGDRN